MKLAWSLLKEMSPELVIPSGTLVRFQDLSGQAWCDDVVILMICDWTLDENYVVSVVKVGGEKTGINPLLGISRAWLGDICRPTFGWLYANLNIYIWPEVERNYVEICSGPIRSACFHENS